MCNPPINQHSGTEINDLMDCETLRAQKELREMEAKQRRCDELDLIFAQTLDAFIREDQANVQQSDAN